MPHRQSMVLLTLGCHNNAYTTQRYDLETTLLTIDNYGLGLNIYSA